MKDGATTKSMVDRAWRGYDVRAMVPWAVLAGVLSLGVLIERWLSEDLAFLAERVGVLFLYIPLAVIWGVLLGIGLYRSVTFTYRLTNRALLVDRGFRWPTEPPLPLQEIVEVRDTFPFPGRWLNIGRVSVTTASGRCLEMTGIHDPRGFAESIRTEVRLAAGMPPVVS